MSIFRLKTAPRRRMVLVLPAAAAANTVKAAKIGGTTVLTNWPPVKGPVTATGITGTFATIKRGDGSTQATFNGHPLYTFTGDAAPGQNNGNGRDADTTART
jgi:predicted lipoprotein with Yx(FWY)xxD motif